MEWVATKQWPINTMEKPAIRWCRLKIGISVGRRARLSSTNQQYMGKFILVQKFLSPLNTFSMFYLWIVCMHFKVLNTDLNLHTEKSYLNTFRILIKNILKLLWLPSLLFLWNLTFSICSHLEKHMDLLLNGRKSIRMFVPMCGKSVDIK